MAHELSFERLIRYDPGESGICVETTLTAPDRSITLSAKVACKKVVAPGGQA